jgi:hypothetical protein
MIVEPLVDYQTELATVAVSWKSRSLPLSQLPDIYRTIRGAYDSAQIYDRADAFLFKERNASRKYILAPRLISKVTPKNAQRWVINLAWCLSMGYGTRPFRILVIGPVLVSIFAGIYYYFGVSFNNHSLKSSFIEYLYFSMTTFATLGFGDLAFGGDHPWFRVLSASEAMLGATWIAIFVAVLSRKLVR